MGYVTVEMKEFDGVGGIHMCENSDLGYEWGRLYGRNMNCKLMRVAWNVY